MNTPVLDAYAGLADALAAVRAAMDEHHHKVGDHELMQLFRAHHRIEAQLASLGLDHISLAGMRDLPHRVGASSTSAWMTGLLTMDPSTAASRVRTATALETLCPATYDRLAAGDIALEQATAVCSIVSDLPTGATERQIVHAERYLLDRAATSNALELRKLHKRVEHVIDPDGLLGREADAPRKRRMNIRDNHDGTQTMSWTGTDEEIAKLKAALNPLAAPQPAADGTRDDRTPEQRRADAMDDLVDRSLRFGNLPTVRGHAPHIIVTISQDNLNTGTGFGITTTGETLTAEAVRRIACSANLHPLHIDGNGIPLRLGRSQRLASPAQWLALVARDGGCVGENCTRPPEWCDAHHLEYWEDLGPTDLENLCLLCPFHHDQVHHHGWDLRVAEDGHIELIPPERVDPYQRPRRNSHWRERTAA
ncbi:MAG: DUF222 domain-containing protein [Sporichthyaceae bacterium]